MKYIFEEGNLLIEQFQYVEIVIFNNKLLDYLFNFDKNNTIFMSIYFNLNFNLSKYCK